MTYSGHLPEKICGYLGRLSLSVYLCQLTGIFVIWYLACHVKIIPYVYSDMLPWYILFTIVLGLGIDFIVTKFIQVTVKKEEGEKNDG